MERAVPPSSEPSSDDRQAVEPIHRAESDAAAPRHRRGDRFVVAVLFSLSGFGGLVYELVWTQQFALVFGASATATAAVLSAYMLGLGAGAALVGRWLDRIRRPVLWYAGLEAAIAASALMVAPALGVLRQLHAVVFADRVLDGGASAAFYGLGAFAVLAVPTTLMGATLPLLVRFWVTHRREISRGVASLYMVNALGAGVGTLTTGFVLIPRLGLGRAIGVAVVINLLVALLAVWRFRSRRLEPLAPSASLADPVEADQGWSRDGRWMGPLAAGAGFVGMAYEVYWTRLLTHPLGGSLYAFATMLAAFLIGIALGSAITLPRSFGRRAAWGGFGLLQLGLAIVSLLTVIGLGRGWLDGWVSVPGGLSIRSVTAVIATLMPGAMLLGASFPLAVRAAASSGVGAAAASGRIYAWNTIGTVFGSILCGFWLLPTLELEGTAALLTAIALVVATIACGTAGGPWRLPGAVAAVGLIGVAFVTVPTPWALLSQGPMGPAFDPATVRYLGVGRSATVMLRDLDGDLRLLSNGLPESAIQARGSRPSRYSVAKWLALAPATARPDARRALVVGFGAGISARAFPQTVESIDVAEIEPEIIAANEAYAAWRVDDPLADPRIRVIDGDARSLLATRDRQYDLIVSQPSHPWTLGAASLFTSEWYEIVRSRLADDGVLGQWIGLRFVDPPLMRSLIATLYEHFAQVEVFLVNRGAIVLLASDAPLDLRPLPADARPHLAAAWREIGIGSPVALDATRWLDAAGARAFAADAEISTDYRNLFLIRSAWTFGQRRREAVGATVAPFDAIRDLQSTRDDLAAVRELIHRRQLDRAEVALTVVDDPRLHRVGRALVDRARGQEAQARRALQALARSAGAATAARREALAALLDSSLKGGSSLPPGLVAAAAAVPDLDAVFLTGQALSRDDLDTARQLDTALASIAPEHPIWTAALRLRIAWREQVGTRELAAEALALSHTMPTARGDLPTLLSRCRLAHAAGESDVVVASLLELAGVVGRRDAKRRGAMPATVRRVVIDPTITEHPRWPEVRQRLDEIGW